MIVIERQELKDQFPNMIKIIQMNHKMGEDIFEELYVKNTPVVGLTTTARYFAQFDGYWIEYTMSHQIRDVDAQLIGRAVEQVIIYEDYVEYESNRVKKLSGDKRSKGLNLN